MKEFFTYVFVVAFVVLMLSIPIFFIGYIFSDDSFVDVMKTSIMISTGFVTFYFIFIFMVFWFTAKR